MAPASRTAAVSYMPGAWLGVVRSGTAVLLPPDTDRALVDSLWTLLASNPEIPEVLDTVTSASGGSLARLPWFGIVGLRGSLQVFLRGRIDLDVRLDSGETVELSGRDVTTWTERRFAAADGFSIAVPDAAFAAGTAAAPAAAPAAPLPLVDGVVLLQGLHCALTGEATSADVPGAAAADSAVPVAAVPVDAAAGAPAPGAGGDEQLLAAAAEADIAAEQEEHDSSAETVLDFPAEDPDAGPDLAGTMQDTPAPDTAEQESTGSYDHLWEQTVMRSIEDAAVRADPEAEPEPAEAEETEEAVVEASDAAEKPAGEEPAAVPAAEPAHVPAVPTGLIDSVPWQTGGERPANAVPPAPRAAPGPDAPPSLFTPPPVPPLSTAPAAHRPPADDADHDGQTIMKNARDGPGTVGQRAAPSDAQNPGTGPMVLARVCPQGHANPPTNAQCACCGRALPGDGVQVRRPRLGRMRLSTGELIDLDQSLIVGRQPSVSRVQGAVMPKLVQVASPGGDISRSHVEVRLEGWHVMLCDLKATNGTVLLREGQAPRRLAQGEMAILFDGDVAELGDGIQLRFEELL